MAKADHATPMTPREVTTRFVREWVFPRWRQLGIVLLVTAGLSAATGAYPLIIKVSFDSLLANQSGILLYILGAVVAVTLARSLFLYAQSVLSTGLIARLSTDLRKHVFRHLISLDFARLTKEAPGHSVSRLTHDVSFVETAATAALNSAIRDTLSVIVLVGTMFYLDWVMSVVVLCIYPIAAWPIISISERLRKVAKRTQSHLGDMTSGLTQIFSAPRLIKAYRLENYADRQASDAFENNFKLRMKAVRTKSQIDPMLEALGGIAVAGVIALAYWRISSGESTVGDFMGFVSALLMAAQPIRGLGSLLGRIQEGIAAGERIYGLLDTMPATAEAATAEPIKVDHGAIQFDAASFQY
ncbi:MAG: ABC transporter transmembrane domain-containing protein, partial [Pseudomonadota bacterium]